MPNSEILLKRAQGTWKSCAQCGVLMPTTNIEDHEKQCTDAVADQHALEQLSSGFILNGMLHAVVGVLSKDFKVPHSIRPIVLIHPSTMNIFGYHAASPVHLKGNKDEKIHKCWPCSAIERSTITFPDNNSFCCAPGDKVIVQLFNGPCDIALEMCLETKVHKDFVTSEKFKKFFLKKHDTSYVKEGMVFRFSYMCYPCQLTITKLIGVLSYLPYKSDVDHVTTSLAILSVEDENPPSKTHGGMPNPEPSKIWKSNIDYSKPFEYFEITLDTEISIVKLEDMNTPKQEGVLLRSIGGLEEQIKELKGIVSTFLNLPGSKKHGKMPKAILITGAPGTGKTLTAKALANEFHINLVTITCSDIYTYSQGTVAALKARCEGIGYSSPSILFFDEIDTLCPKSSGFAVSNEERIIVLAVIELLDALIKNPHRKVLVLAATSKPEAVDPLLLRPGRFDKEIKFDIPDAHARYEIIKKLLHNIRNDITEEQIIQISESASGYTGADLFGVCDKSVVKALVRNSNSDAQTHAKDSYVVKFDDIIASLKVVKPSAMREFQVEVPQVLWEDIGGMHQLKQDIMDDVALPLKHPEAFIRLGISPCHGALMYGPPGCSKTMIARALATESKLNFISVKGPELLSKWVGESEKAVHAIFAKARSCAPCIIFFDEIDSLTYSRDDSRSSSNVGLRVLSQLLCEIDGVDVLEGVQIIAATNCPELMDSALLRPGRFDRLIYVPLPDSLTRKEIFNIQLKKMPHAADINVENLVELTEGYSGAEIVAVCRDAALLAISDEISSGTESHITELHLMKALKHRPPKTSEERVNFYEQFKARRN